MDLAYWTLLGAVAPVFVTIIAGYAVRKTGWLTADADRSLLQLTINLLTPCLIFDSVLGNTALKSAGNIILAPLVGFVTVAVGFVIGGLVAKGLRFPDSGERRTFAIATGLYNYGYIPLPLALSLFDNQTAGVLFMHNLGVEIALWTIGVAVLTATSAARAWRQMLNPPVLAIVAAVLLNLLHAQAWLPQWTLQTAHLIGGAAIPLGLLLTGATFADVFRVSELHGGLRVMSAAALLRIAITPWMFLLIARFLPCSAELKTVIVIQAAMPAAVVPIVLTKLYGGSPATAVRVVIATTAIALVTIPFWIRFGLRFAGSSPILQAIP